MQISSELLKSLMKSAEEKLVVFANSESKDYQDLVEKLILQGIVRLLENNVFVRVRSQDRDFVVRLFQKIEDEYVKLMKNETGRDYTIKLTIDDVNLDNQWYFEFYLVEESFFLMIIIRFSALILLMQDLV